MEPDILPLALRSSGLLTISAKVPSPGAGGCRAARSSLPAPSAAPRAEPFHLRLALGIWLQRYPEAPNFLLWPWCSGKGSPVSPAAPGGAVAAATSP